MATIPKAKGPDIEDDIQWDPEAQRKRYSREHNERMDQYVESLKKAKPSEPPPPPKK